MKLMHIKDLHFHRFKNDNKEAIATLSAIQQNYLDVTSVIKNKTIVSVQGIASMLKQKFDTTFALYEKCKNAGVGGGNELLPGNNRDLFERKRAEGQLRRSEALLNAAQRLAKVGGWEWDVDKQTMFWTDEVYRIHDFQPSEFIPGAEEHIKQSLECYDPEDRPVISDAFRRCAEEGLAYDLEFPFTTAKGRRKWIRTLAEPVIEDDRIVRVVGNIMDITEHKRVAEALQKERDFVENLFNTAQTVILVLDTEGRIVRFNRYMEGISGYMLAEVRGKDWFSTFLPAEDRTRTRDLFLKAVADIQTRGNVSPIMKKDGGKCEIEWYDKTLKDREGNVVGLLAVGLDITERIKMETRLQQAQKMEAMGNLASGIAHDFNNILFPIVGMSEMLLEDLPSDSHEYENALEILTAGQRGSDLVKQILSFSRQTEHKMIPVRIQRILKEVLKLSHSTIPSNIEITKNIQSDCGLVMADPTQLHQIAMNLITNAYHAVEQTGGKISVLLKETELVSDDLANISLEPGRYAVLSVYDTGCGIDPAVMNKIFDPYFTTKEQGKGTGLGLAVVYGIIKKHHGDIKVYSEVGKGTAFNVYIPLIEKSPDAISAEKVESYETGTEKVLLVDDEEPVARLEKQMLERLGYRVTSRLSSVDALEAFRANSDAFDLVITDMTMPNMTGDQLARELITIRPDIPVIICTGFSERISQNRAAAMGVKGFLMKPIIKLEMARMVRKVLDEGGGNQECW